MICIDTCAHTCMQAYTHAYADTHIYIYIYIYIYMCAHLYMSGYTLCIPDDASGTRSATIRIQLNECISADICIDLCMYAYMCTKIIIDEYPSVYLHIGHHVRTHLSPYIYIYIYMSNILYIERERGVHNTIYVSSQIYVYIYIHIYIYIYISMCIYSTSHAFTPVSRHISVPVY